MFTKVGHTLSGYMGSYPSVTKTTKTGTPVPQRMYHRGRKCKDCLNLILRTKCLLYTCPVSPYWTNLSHLRQMVCMICMICMIYSHSVDLDFSRQMYIPDLVWPSSCCRVGSVVYSGPCSTCFLGWIWSVLCRSCKNSDNGSGGTR